MLWVRYMMDGEHLFTTLRLAGAKGLKLWQFRRSYVSHSYLRRKARHFSSGKKMFAWYWDGRHTRIRHFRNLDITDCDRPHFIGWLYPAKA
jgi:hypothetical protein